MSSPFSNLQKGKKTPFTSGSRAAPFKQIHKPESDVLNQLMANIDHNTKKTSNASAKSSGLMTSMVNRLSAVEKKLSEYENIIKEKDKRIRVLEEKCEIYKKAQGYESDQVAELERKCHKLQNQIHSMEDFLEDYGMIWIGTNNSSDNEDEKEYEDEMSQFLTEPNSLWNPDISISHPKCFHMDYDLVLKNIQELNLIAGEGEHFVKHTKDGARLEVKEPIPLTLYANGIYMFGGPFRPFEDLTTQECMQDIMDGYFPTELQKLYPDGVPLKIKDKRNIYFKDQRLERIFPGQGHALSPDKGHTTQSVSTNADNYSDRKTETSNQGYRQSVDNFLSNLPSSVIKSGKIVDIRDGLKETLQGNPIRKNDVIICETEAVEEMKLRMTSSRQSRPSTAISITTLRIKSETGSQTYVLKMKYTQTIQDVRSHLEKIRGDNLPVYHLKTSFPNKSYDDVNKTLKECGLVPNATLYMVVSK